MMDSSVTPLFAKTYPSYIYQARFLNVQGPIYKNLSENRFFIEIDFSNIKVDFSDIKVDFSNLKLPLKCESELFNFF